MGLTFIQKVAFLKFLRISRWKTRSHHLFSRYLNHDTKNLTYTPLVFLIHALLDFYFPNSVQYFHQSTLKLCYDSPSKEFATIFYSFKSKKCHFLKNHNVSLFSQMKISKWPVYCMYSVITQFHSSIFLVYSLGLCVINFFACFEQKMNCEF